MSCLDEIISMYVVVCDAYEKKLRSYCQDLLGHKSNRMTTHYSRAELMNLWEAASKVCDVQEMSQLTLLRTVTCQSRAKVAQGSLLVAAGNF